MVLSPQLQLAAAVQLNFSTDRASPCSQCSQTLVPVLQPDRHPQGAAGLPSPESTYRVEPTASQGCKEAAVDTACPGQALVQVCEVASLRGGFLLPLLYTGLQ